MKFLKTTFNRSIRRSFNGFKRISSAALILVLLCSSFATTYGRQDKSVNADGAKPTPNQPAQSQAANGEKSTTQGQDSAQKTDSEKASPASNSNQAKTDSQKPEDKKDEKKTEPAQGGGLKYPLPDLKPLGAAGKKTVTSTDQATDEFIPMPDRWRFGWPRFRRYQADIANDLPFVQGAWYDPFNQNLAKADYPIFGNKYFMNLNLQSVTNINPRQLAAGARTKQLFVNQNFVAGVELFKGDGVFEPKDWSIRITGVLNVNTLSVGAFNKFTTGRARINAEEAFFEKRLAVLSVNYDIVSLRLGMQNFNSDFRGFVFADNQLGARLFGNLHSNRDQYNLAYFSMRKRDIVSQLHNFNSRRQDVVIANWYRQDIITPGYTGMVNFHYNHDRGAAIGDIANLNAVYLGFHGDGHWGDWNVDHAFYQVFGHDDHNRLANREVSINAQMAAFEISRDVNWWRYRASVFYASGDGNMNNGKARGFDMITDNPNFAGGQFMFWTQQQSVLSNPIGFLSNKFSLLPSMRDKFSQRSNFVNPGLFLVNGGFDVRVTPKLKLSPNVSYLRFADASILRQLTANPNLDNGVGWDVSFGAKYRPFLNENFNIVFGYSTLFPTGGFRTALGSGKPLLSGFAAIQFAF